ncbi:MAG: Smr/MutS family protein [Spirochaetaceae bacterium]|jgi:DNA-nicking Smr family endonuclease|nr:Smr/MutS family protein [Spirochaetaceae bacterium]
MDFGSILDEWERRTAAGETAAASRKTDRSARLKRPSPGNNGELPKRGREETLPRLDPLTVWLRQNPVYDKDAEAEEGAGEEAAWGERRRRLLARRPDAILDLHGLTRDEAWDALDSFFRDGRRRGFKKLLVIHGKGNHSNGAGVLKETCRTFIERCPFAGESGRGKPADGASGATWVILKGYKG